MRVSGGNKERHWHWWTPNDKDTKTTKTCKCGATKRWSGKRWVISPTPAIKKDRDVTP